jgi:hypothetical protein
MLLSSAGAIMLNTTLTAPAGSAPPVGKPPVAAAAPRNLSFIHIQKTGGESIEAALGLTAPLHLKWPTSQCALAARRNPHAAKLRRHASAVQARVCCGPTLRDEWDRSFKFAFVRNPWARWVSWWAMWNNKRRALLRKYGTKAVEPRTKKTVEPRTKATAMMAMMRPLIACGCYERECSFKAFVFNGCTNKVPNMSSFRQWTYAAACGTSPATWPIANWPLGRLHPSGRRTGVHAEVEVACGQALDFVGKLEQLTNDLRVALSWR